MQQPQSIEQILKLLSGVDPASVRSLEAKARRGQFTFAATQFALKSGCRCEACLFLGKAVEEELEDARKEAGIDAPRDDPLPGPGATVPVARTSGDADRPDLPV
jgi:hypothetical protein